MFRPLVHCKAVLQAARVIQKPLLHRDVPLVTQAWTVRLHRWRSAEGVLICSEAIAQQFQTPRPATDLRLGDKPASIKRGDPLLSWILRLPAARDGPKGMTSGFKSGAKGGPLRRGQPAENGL